MKKLLAVVLVQALLPTLAWPQIPRGYSGVPSGGGGISLISSTSAGCASGCTAAFTTSAINTQCSGTGCNTLIVIAQAAFSVFTAPTDSAGNTWTPLTRYGTGGAYIQFFYCFPCTTSATHTFTDSTMDFHSIAVGAWQGITSGAGSIVDKQSGATTVLSTGGTLATGSITPANSGELLVTAVGAQDTGADSVDSSFTIIQHVNYAASTHYSITLAWQVQAVAGAINPTWTTLGNGQNCSVNIVSFNPTGGGGGGGGITLTGHTLSKSTAAQTTVTTSAINCTGTNLIVVAVAFAASLTQTVSDSSSNSYTAGTQWTDGDIGLQMFYKYAPTVTSSMTFTVTAGAADYDAIAVTCWSSTTGTFDVSNHALCCTVTAGGTYQPGSITTAAAGELIVTALGDPSNTTNDTIGGGFTISDQTLEATGANSGLSMAYFVQSTAGAINPTWTVGNQNTANYPGGGTAGIAAFK